MSLFNTQLKFDISEIINPTTMDYKLIWAKQKAKLVFARKYGKIRMMAKLSPEEEALRQLKRERDLIELKKKNRSATADDHARERVLIQQIYDDEEALYKLQLKRTDALEDSVLLEEKLLRKKRDVLGLERGLMVFSDKILENTKKRGTMEAEGLKSLQAARDYQQGAVQSLTKALHINKEATEVSKRITSLQAEILKAKENGTKEDVKALQQQKLMLRAVQAVEGVIKGIKKLWEGVKAVGSAIKSGFDVLLSPVNAIDKALGGVLGNLWDIVKNPLTLFTTMVTLGIERMLALDDAAVNLSRSLGITGSQLSKMTNISQGLYFQYRDMGLTLEEANGYVQDMVEGMGNLDYVTRQNVEMVTQMSKGWGVSSSSASEFLGMMTKMTGEGDKGSKKMMNYAKAMSDAAGVPVKKVIEDVSNASDNAYGFMSGMPKQMIKTAVEARRLGMTLDSVSNVARGLLDVQTSMQGEMEASIMTGKQLNFSAARRKALEGDILGATQDIMDQMGGIDEFNKLDILQKESVAKATGLSVKELSKTLQQREQEKKLADERIARENKMNAALDKGLDMFEKITKISERWADFFSDIKDILAFAIMPYITKVMNYMEHNFEKIKKIVKNFVDNIVMPLVKLFWELGKDALGLVNDELTGGGNILDSLNKKIKVWATVLQEDIIPLLKKIYFEYMKPALKWVIDVVKETIEWFKNGGWDKIKETFGEILKAAGSLWTAFKDILKSLGMDFSGAQTGKGVSGALNTILDTVKAIAKWIGDNPKKTLMIIAALKFPGIISMMASLTGFLVKGGFNAFSKGLPMMTKFGKMLNPKVVDPTGPTSKLNDGYKSGVDKTGKTYFKDSSGKFAKETDAVTKTPGTKGSGKFGQSEMGGMITGAATTFAIGNAIADITKLATADKTTVEGEKSKREAVGSLAGAGIGAIIGTMIAPGIGTAIGAALGGPIGQAVSGLDMFKGELEDAADAMNVQEYKIKTALKEVETDAKSIVTRQFGVGSPLSTAVMNAAGNLELNNSNISLLTESLKNAGTFSEQEITDMVTKMSEDGKLTASELKDVMIGADDSVAKKMTGLTDVIDVYKQSLQDLTGATEHATKIKQAEEFKKNMGANKDVMKTMINELRDKYNIGSLDIAGNTKDFQKFAKEVMDMQKGQGLKVDDEKAWMKKFQSGMQYQSGNMYSSVMETLGTDAVDVLEDMTDDYTKSLKVGKMKIDTEIGKLVEQTLKDNKGKSIEDLTKIIQDKNANVDATTIKKTLNQQGIKDGIIRVNDVNIQTADKDQILATTDMQGMLKTVGDMAREDQFKLLTGQTDETLKFTDGIYKKELRNNKKWFGTDSEPYLRTIADVLSNYFDEEMNTFKKDQIAASKAQLQGTPPIINRATGGIINASLGQHISTEQSAVNSHPGYKNSRGAKVVYNDAEKIISDGNKALIVPPYKLDAAAKALGYSNGGIVNMADGGKITREQTAGYAKNAGFPDSELSMAVAIAEAESGLNPSIQSPPNKDKWGSIDRGLWQINSHWSPDYQPIKILDPDINAKEAYRLWKAKQDWTPWSTFKNNLYQSHLSGVTPSNIVQSAQSNTVSAVAGWLVSMIPGFADKTQSSTLSSSGTSNFNSGAMNLLSDSDMSKDTQSSGFYGGINKNVYEAFKAIKSKFPALYISSGRRNTLIKGTNRPSRHNFGEAIDLGSAQTAGGSPSNPPPMGTPLDQAIEYVTRGIGGNFTGPGVSNGTGGQSLWRTSTGGNHFNHIHLGIHPDWTFKAAEGAYLEQAKNEYLAPSEANEATMLSNGGYIKVNSPVNDAVMYRNASGGMDIQPISSDDNIIATKTGLGGNNKEIVERLDMLINAVKDGKIIQMDGKAVGQSLIRNG